MFSREHTFLSPHEQTGGLSDQGTSSEDTSPETSPVSLEITNIALLRELPTRLTQYLSDLFPASLGPVTTVNDPKNTRQKIMNTLRTTAERQQRFRGRMVDLRIQWEELPPLPLQLSTKYTLQGTITGSLTSSTTNHEPVGSFSAPCTVVFQAYSLRKNNWTLRIDCHSIPMNTIQFSDMAQWKTYVQEMEEGRAGHKLT